MRAIDNITSRQLWSLHRVRLYRIV